MKITGMGNKAKPREKKHRFETFCRCRKRTAEFHKKDPKGDFLEIELGLAFSLLMDIPKTNDSTNIRIRQSFFALIYWQQRVIFLFRM
jgi:hypothetical protein